MTEGNDKRKAEPIREGFTFPDWCDLSCPYAGFPPGGALDGSGSCRTFLALYCRCLDRPVAKNGPCQAAREAAKEEKPREP
ncbi:MAG: hypothetical protein JW797_01755 [Bradymonadales bacterium]|nr:hypothetical protein [Bradymonadales bacterium]